MFQFVHNTSNGPITFGPAFNMDFLLHVYDLQEQIEQVMSWTLKTENYVFSLMLKLNKFVLLLFQLGEDEGNGLEKICFAALHSPYTGPTQRSQCVVQSLWGYFQDDVDLFNDTSTDSEGFTVNYLDHIMKCLQ